jgi:predicted dehydrogenase/threonine dehydrogenase-like Zn-dependent dehydrogenase
MKQVLQHFRNGQIEIAEIPCPGVRPGHLLVHSAVSLISPGTERMLVEFAQAGLIGKARAQPERVREVLTKVRVDGVVPALEAVRNRLSAPAPLGYCNVGRVIEVGHDVRGFAVGDRVVSNGAHAEVVCVPSTLAAQIPDSVDDEAASFAVLGAIALNGIRLLQPTLGESFAVIGLGVLGLLAVQLLRAHGCRVLGVDVDAARCDLGRSMGCDVVVGSDAVDAVGAARSFSRARGVDGVLITASATTHEIVHQAAQMSRRRGRVVLVGVVGLNLLRSDFYEKELSFQVACSYGPGRYDARYEIAAQDYPLPYVRWTAARNFEAVLDLLARGTLDVRPLISGRLPQSAAAQAYGALVHDSSTLGLILSYPRGAAPTARVTTLAGGARRTAMSTTPVVGVIGAGLFAKQVLLPAIAAAGVPIKSIATTSGVTALQAARECAADEAITDYQRILRTPEINTVFIATRHDTHARLVVEALEAGKHVFVEKPLAIDPDDLQRVQRAAAAHPDLQLLVGFNRRFAPHAVAARQLLRGRSRPIAMRLLVNAGELPPDHWASDQAVGGGRIIGEACHFIDLCLYLAGSPIISVQAARMGSDAGVPDDTLSITLTFADGSLATIDYWTNGARSYPKEHIEIFSEGRILIIDNWRLLRHYDWRGAPRMRMRQDKGHRAEVAAFLACVAEGGAALIPSDDLAMVTAATFAVQQSAAAGIVIQMPSMP